MDKNDPHMKNCPLCKEPVNNYVDKGIMYKCGTIRWHKNKNRFIFSNICIRIHNLECNMKLFDQQIEKLAHLYGNEIYKIVGEK